MGDFNRYQIKYLDSRITQIKTLIPYSVYYKGKQISLRPVPQGLSDKEIKEFHRETDKLKKEYFAPYGNYFTEDSPLWSAISTNVLNCNGTYKVEINEI